MPNKYVNLVMRWKNCIKEYTEYIHLKKGGRKSLIIKDLGPKSPPCAALTH